jgi:hypothetical protein
LNQQPNQKKGDFAMKTKETVLLLSDEGILDLDGQNDSDVPFENASVIAGDVHRDRLAVIAGGHDVWTYAEGTWSHETSTDTTLNCICWTADERLLVGTEAARLAWVSDGGLDFINGFDAVPERTLWKTPWGGPPDVRSLAVSTDGTLYANIHVGWIARSQDDGKTWQNLREGLEMDVHQVATHPADPRVVFAATARGFYLSKDYGDTFAHQHNGMPYSYQRACACFPQRDVYLVSTSRGPRSKSDALLYRSEDDGKTWSQVNGLPEQVSENIDTFQILTRRDGHALVIVDDTAVYETRDWGVNWSEVGNDYPRLYGALVVRD